MSTRRVPKVFICYRRDDAGGTAGRLSDDLAERFGPRNVFRDVSTLGSGTEFAPAIEHKIKSSDVLLAVIGRHWLAITEEKIRLVDQKDFVQREIVTALKQGIHVIPVLVEGASMPPEEKLPDALRPLVGRHAFELRDDQSWASNVSRLIKELESQVNPSEDSDSDVPLPEAKLAARSYFYSLFGGAIAGLVSGLIVGWLYFEDNPGINRWRVLLNGLCGVIVGAITTISINWGMGWCSKVLRGSSYAKVVGALVGGIPGGIVAAVAGGSLFMNLEGGNVISAKLLWAIAFSPTAIALGILMQDLKQSWIKAGVIIIILIGVIAMTIIVGKAILPDDDLLKTYFKDSPISNQIMGVLVLGEVFGAMSGLQVGSTLFAYDRFRRRLGLL